MRPLPPDFLAGSTRIRARLPQLRMLQAEADPALRLTEGRSLMRELVSFFSHSARPVVGVLVARWDLADVIALLRGAIHRRDVADRLAAVSAVGAVTPELARDIAHAPDGTTAVARLQECGLPDPDTARALADSWVAYELHEDPEELETDIARSAEEHWRLLLRQLGSGAQPVAELLAEERDLANLQTVLRLPGWARPRRLAYGRLGEFELNAALQGGWQPVIRVRPEWRAALPSSGDPVSPVMLERTLRTGLLRRAWAKLLRGDPFTAEVAVGYALCIEDLARPRSLIIETESRAA